MVDLGEVFHSPFIVPVTALVMTLGIVIASKVAEVRKRQLEFEERMAALAKGLPLPPLESESKNQMFAAIHGTPIHQVQQMQEAQEERGMARRRGGVRRAGIVLIATGIGLALFFITLSWVVGERNLLAGAASALIPFAIGVGLLVDAVLSRREQEQAAADAALAVRE